MVLLNVDAHKEQTTLQQLVDYGLSKEQAFVEPILKPGEAKKKLAFFSFSSGTTGKPKVRLILYSLYRNMNALTTNHAGSSYCAPFAYIEHRTDGSA